MTETRQVSDKNFLRQFQSSFSLDRRLFAAAIYANTAYCNTLFHAGILNRQEAERIKNGLSTILKRADYDRNYFEQTEAENVHSFIEGRLVQLVGEIAAKLKFGRTVEEQTLTALRIWLRKQIVEVSGQIKKLQREILRSAESKYEFFFIEKEREVYFAEWCIGYFEICQQDCERLDEVWRRVNVFSRIAKEDGEQHEEIDYEEFSQQLKFEGIVEGNSSFAFDFALEYVNASAILMLHLARLAEDLKTLAKDSDYSSILEIFREKTSRIFGCQTSLQTLLINLRLKQNFSEILNAVFETYEITKICLEAMKNVLGNLEFNEETLKVYNLSEERRKEISEMIENVRMELKTEE